jgi:hypothetical protein
MVRKGWVVADVTVYVAWNAHTELGAKHEDIDGSKHRRRDLRSKLGVISWDDDKQ